MPSGNYKIIQVKEERIDLGKFGSFDGKLLVGKYYGIPLEITNQTLKRIPIENCLSEFDIDIKKDNGLTNDQITKNSQQLSQSEIEEMKLNKNHKEIIQTLLENNENFNDKTEYSKAKYVVRKMKKFAKIFIPLEPNCLNLIDFYQLKSPEKIRELRIDSLSQILNLGNVRSGSRILCCDDTGGLLGLGILERIGSGKAFFVHDGKQGALELLKYQRNQNFHTYPWYRFTTPLVLESGEGRPNTEGSNYNQDQAEAQERKLLRFEKLTAEHEDINSGDFDALILASKFEPYEIIERLLPLLKKSAKVVCFAPRKEMLLEAYNKVRLSSQYCNTQLVEPWMREYQVPVLSSGTHPMMMTNGNGGFIFHATVVSDDDVVIQKTSYKKQRLMKKEKSKG